MNKLFVFFSILLFSVRDAAVAAGPAPPPPSELTFSTLQIIAACGITIAVVLLILFIRSFWSAPKEGSLSAFRKMLSDYPVMVIILGALLLVIGISISDNGWGLFIVDKNFVGHLIAEFGIALIIAYFISISIEEYARRRHNTHVAEQLELIERSVFEAIYKVRIDPKLFNFIEDTLFRHPFYRRHYRIAMKIALHESVVDKKLLDPEDPVIVSITLRSVIHNISITRREKILTTMIERSTHSQLADEPRLCSMKIGKNEYTFANDDTFKRTFEQSKASVVVSEGFKRYSTSTFIDAGDSLHVEYQYRLVKFARDEMSWRVADPAEDFILAISHSDKLVSFAAPMHARREVEPRRNIGGIDLELEISEPLFPFNGAVVWWRPAEPQALLAAPNLAAGQTTALNEQQETK